MKTDRVNGYHPCCGTDCIDVRDLEQERDEARAALKKEKASWLRLHAAWEKGCHRVTEAFVRFERLLRRRRRTIRRLQSRFEMLAKEAKRLNSDRDEARSLLADSERRNQWLMNSIETTNVVHVGLISQAQDERDEARAEVEHLRRGIEVYRADHHAAVDRCGCEVCAWEDEDDRRREKPDLA